MSEYMITVAPRDRTTEHLQKLFLPNKGDIVERGSKKYRVKDRVFKMNGGLEGESMILTTLILEDL